MKKRFRTCDLSQPYLLPPSLQDWLPENHLARMVAEVVDELDLTPICRRYERKDGRGQAAYHPVMMTRLLLYAYCVGKPSSRKIEKATYDEVPFRYLAADQHPDHDTIAAFRQENLDALAGLFVESLRLCQRAGMVKLGHVAIDGTKIAANASRRKSYRYEKLRESEQALERRVEELLARAQQVDGEEDARYGRGKKEEDLPQQLQKTQERLKWIRQAKEGLEREAQEKAAEAEREREARQASGRRASAAEKKRWSRVKTGEPSKTVQVNSTDPDSRLMKDNGGGGGFVQGYNSQAAVASGQIIVAQTVVNEAADKQQLVPMVKLVQKTLAQVGEPTADPDCDAGTKPELVPVETITADSGYWSEAAIQDEALQGIRVLVPPDGPKHETQRAANSPRSEAAQQMREALASEPGATLYRQRKATVEPVFGQIKQARGMRRFVLRGLRKVQGEWSLICATHNLMKLFQVRGALATNAAA